MTFDEIIKDIDSLPPLSNAANIIQSMYASGLENINLARLIKVIEADAMLTANILKMINAPFYGFSQQIASIAQAVTLFGTRRIHMLVVQYAMEHTIHADTSVYGFAHAQFNELCHLQSALMMQWYSKIELRDAQFLTPLALIMESGKLILAKEVMKSDYCGEFRRGFNECESIEEYERDLIGVTSYTLSAALFHHWNLEPIYIEVLKYLDVKNKKLLNNLDDKTRSYIHQVDVIRTAINVKNILTDVSILEASKKVEVMGYDAQMFIHIANRVRDNYLKQKEKTWYREK